MKKALLIILIACSIACSKKYELNDFTDYANVVIVAGRSEESGDVIADYIDELVDKTFYVTLENKEYGIKEKVCTGNMVSLPCGKWRVKYELISTENSLKRPTYRVDEEIDIKRDTVCHFNIDMKFTCYAVLFHKLEIEDVTYYKDGIWKDAKFVDCDSLLMTFVPKYNKTIYSTIDEMRFKMDVNMMSDYIPTEIKFGKDWGKDKIKFEYGKYYRVRPRRGDKSYVGVTIDTELFDEGNMNGDK